MLLAGLPAAELTDDRRKRLHEIVKGLTDDVLTMDDLAGDDVPAAADDVEDARTALHEHVELLGEAASRRDVAVLRLPYMPYPIMFTGGMSWGDSPTEMFDTFAALAEVEPIFEQLEGWAEDDARTDSLASNARSNAWTGATLAVLKEFTGDLRAAFGTGDGDAIDEERLDWPDLAATNHRALGVLRRHGHHPPPREESS
jgi:hypothetical protein